jgi:hypothetical protein
MPWINHPARQDGPASLLDWLRYRLGTWMQRVGTDLEHRALHPNDTLCPECGHWISKGYPCDHIPF